MHLVLRIGRHTTRAPVDTRSARLCLHSNSPGAGAGAWSIRRSRHASGVRMSKRNETPEERAARKEQVKQEKAAKKARREGHVEDDYGQKDCSLCNEPKDLLIRCQIDKTEKWHMVCGKCWNQVSGGVVDGDKQHPDYRKNLHKKDKAPA